MKETKYLPPESVASRRNRQAAPTLWVLREQKEGSSPSARIRRWEVKRERKGFPQQESVEHLEKS